MRTSTMIIKLTQRFACHKGWYVEDAKAKMGVFEYEHDDLLYCKLCFHFKISGTELQNTAVCIGEIQYICCAMLCTELSDFPLQQTDAGGVSRQMERAAELRRLQRSGHELQNVIFLFVIITIRSMGCWQIASSLYLWCARRAHVLMGESP